MNVLKVLLGFTSLMLGMNLTHAEMKLGGLWSFRRALGIDSHWSGAIFGRG